MGAFHDLKHTLDIRPVFHRLEARIRAHVLLCWLALLLIRIAEHRTGHTWRRLRETLEKMHLGEFQMPEGRVQQRTETTTEQRAIFGWLGISEPRRIYRIEQQTS